MYNAPCTAPSLQCHIRPEHSEHSNNSLRPDSVGKEVMNFLDSGCSGENGSQGQVP